jgi:hypothetical protein
MDVSYFLIFLIFRIALYELSFFIKLIMEQIDNKINKLIHLLSIYNHIQLNQNNIFYLKQKCTDSEYFYIKVIKCNSLHKNDKLNCHIYLIKPKSTTINLGQYYLSLKTVEISSEEEFNKQINKIKN